jgi:hypothetical protein
MSRTLTSATTNALASQLTLPGYLVRISWISSVVRLTSRDTITWNGNAYTGFGVVPKGLEWRGSAEQGGTLRLDNSSGAYSVLALSEGVADVPITVWIYDAAATANADPVCVFDGVGDSCQIMPDAITIKVTSKRSRALFAPRSYITQDNGFSIVPPEGKTIEWGGQRYTFTRQR